ncbi:hypothetical protein JWG45_02230, partial [Leptospira sp. 201903070]
MLEEIEFQNNTSFSDSGSLLYFDSKSSVFVKNQDVTLENEERSFAKGEVDFLGPDFHFLKSLKTFS